MRSPCVLFALVLVLGVALGCSDDGGGSKTDGGSGGAGGGGTGNGGAGGGQNGDGGSDGPGTCTGPLSQAAAFCQANLNDQVAGATCDDPMPTVKTCGNYKVWEWLFIGSQTCVYDSAGTTLVAARNCDSAFTDMCASGCYEYGLAPSAYANGCGAESPGCPP